jgi:thiamine biosynthesis lipoprotein
MKAMKGFMCFVASWFAFWSASAGAAIVAPAPPPIEVEASDEIMGTTFSVVLYGDDRARLEAAARAALDEAHRLDRLLSNYLPSSEWSAVNREAAERPVAVSRELFELLAACLEYSRQSDGAFDITVGPLMKVWGFFKGEGTLAPPEQLRPTLAVVGFRHVQLDREEQTVRFAIPGVEIDPGGIGKGYAVDRMVEVLKEHGIESALISAGASSLYGLGAPPGEPDGWRVPIRDPADPRRAAADVRLRDMSLSTSGSYEKFFRAGGRLYSHIMDPRTGYPADGAVAVSVLAPRTMDSEAWTKPYFVNGREWTAEHVPAGSRVLFCGAGDLCEWIDRRSHGPSGPGLQTSLQAEEVASGFPGGEGPVWSRDGYLIFSDYSRDRLYKYVPGGVPEVFREESHGANGNTLDAQGRLYSCEYKSRRVTRTNRDGQIEVFAERFEGKRFNAPNDIVVRRDGHVYFTDPLFTPLDQRELDFFGVYHVAPDGAIEAIARLQTRPNGVTLSPDGRVLYVANTDERNVRAYDLDAAGRASNERVVIEGLPGGPDGIRTDAAGNIYVTARGVSIYSPDGSLLGRIVVPVNPRNLAFGGEDWRTLYLVGNSIYRVRVPTPGAVQY